MDVKKTLEELTEAVVTLKKAHEKGMQDKDQINRDLRLKLSKYENARKGLFAGDEDDVEAARGIDDLLMARTKSDKVIEFQAMNDQIVLTSQLLGCHPTQLKTYHQFTQSTLFKDTALSMGGSAGYGSDWVPVGYSSQLYDRIRLELSVAPLFQPIPMPTDVYKPPVLLTDSTSYLIAENTGVDDFITSANLVKGTTPTTSSFTLTAKKLGARVVFSEELNEDALVPVLPIITNNLVVAQATAMETAIINGDTSTIHMDVGVTNAYDARKAWMGLRRLCITGAKSDLSTLNGDNLLALKAKMGRYGIKPSDLALIVGISGYNKLLNLKDSANNPLVTTIEKYGPNATIVQGELGRVYGIPVVISEYVREDLNAVGLYDGSDVTRTVMILVNRKGYAIGDRRTLKVKVAESVQTDQQILVCTMRKAFSPIYAASDPSVAIAYNISS